MINQKVLELALTAVGYATNYCNSRSSYNELDELQHAVDTGDQSQLSKSTIEEAILCLKMYQNHSHTMTDSAIHHIKSETSTRN